MTLTASSGLDARKYALTMLEAGDYICPSNDDETLWRFVRYEDGKVWGLVCDYERRDFWRVLRAPIADVQSGRVSLDDVSEPPWVETARHLPTRKAALATVFGG